jgi:hypothetical protein
MIDGITVKMGGKEWVVPPLTLKQLRKLEPKLAGLNQGMSPTDMKGLDDVVEILHAALSRNYPELTSDEVEDLVDMGNFLQAIQAVMGISGLKKSGEAEAGSLSAGETFTASLPQGSAGGWATSRT